MQEYFSTEEKYSTNIYSRIESFLNALTFWQSNSHNWVV